MGEIKKMQAKSDVIELHLHLHLRRATLARASMVTHMEDHQEREDIELQGDVVDHPESLCGRWSCVKTYSTAFVTQLAQQMEKVL
ncbi:hypothetical protein BDA96_06G031900 [Sorghum bicolor]|uniref:Uncharacterized protein n=2 Tax=Sorghum bicolor TaxID=4558 RepID=A0A921UAT0_SORBI|nr:hypothetical protein BDA96_06G031900 [Sorghum bicolor]OQU81222.1 hypothetical protein SORBI_3006G029550 [Sorghum bicolor]